MNYEILSNITVSWTDVIDILIVTFILYRFFLIIQGTLAVQMFTGIFLLLLASYTAQHFSLYTIRWLLQDFLKVWLVAILIIFQPELRRALAEVGQRGFFRRQRVQGEQILDELCRAVSAMSKTKTGAIIVLERDTGLREYRERGSKVDAQVTSELLRAIFYPENPLHDGAVIISEGRIAAAACFLPLSKNPQLGRAAGSRHRAAIGISELSDALVIVVSEETGKISLTIDGKLQADLDVAALRKILDKIYLTAQPKGIQIR